MQIRKHTNRNVGRTFASHQKISNTNMWFCKIIITSLYKTTKCQENDWLFASLSILFTRVRSPHCLMKADRVLSAWHLVLLHPTTRHNLSAISGLSHEATFRHRHVPLSLSGWQHLDWKSQHTSFTTPQHGTPELLSNISFMEQKLDPDKVSVVYEAFNLQIPMRKKSITHIWYHQWPHLLNSAVLSSKHCLSPQMHLLQLYTVLYSWICITHAFEVNHWSIVVQHLSLPTGWNWDFEGEDRRNSVWEADFLKSKDKREASVNFQLARLDTSWAQTSLHFHHWFWECDNRQTTSLHKRCYHQEPGFDPVCYTQIVCQSSSKFI